MNSYKFHGSQNIILLLIFQPVENVLKNNKIPSLLPIQKQVAGQIWPMHCSVPTLDLAGKPGEERKEYHTPCVYIHNTYIYHSYIVSATSSRL